MNAKQVLGRLDTIQAKISSLLHEETTSRAFLVAVLGAALFSDLRHVMQRIEERLDRETMSKDPTGLTGGPGMKGDTDEP